MATNAVYQKRGTRKIFAGSGGDAVISLASKATATGRLSARLDMGAFPRTTLYRWHAQFEFTSATGLVVGNVLRVYAAFWNDDTTPAEANAGVGSADADYNTEALLANLSVIGSVVIDRTSVTTIFETSGYLLVPTRYLSVVVWNASGGTLSASTTLHKVILTPEYDDIQAAA